MSSRVATTPDQGGLNVRSMIAERAYYKAEQRGFQPGYELVDWLEAEREQLESVSMQPKVGAAKKAKATKVAKAGARKKRSTKTAK